MTNNKQIKWEKEGVDMVCAFIGNKLVADVTRRFLGSYTMPKYCVTIGGTTNYTAFDTQDEAKAYAEKLLTPR